MACGSLFPDSGPAAPIPAGAEAPVRPGAILDPALTGDPKEAPAAPSAIKSGQPAVADGPDRAAASTEPVARVSPADDERFAEAHGLFLTACASCHGEDGDGKGTAELDRPARSFLEGGFSFGNTPDALARTITFGIPGTPMPAWGEAYDERQRRLLAEYVLALGPPGTEVDAEQTLMAVGTRPAVARGILPSIGEGAPLRPRGLLIGTPAGLTFEYRIDDVRLLGVRQGDFVARDDWIGRGGAPLRPLGTLVLLEGDGDPPATFSQRTIADEPEAAPSAGEDAPEEPQRVEITPLHAQLTSTTIDDEVTATIGYRLEREDGTPHAHVQERIEPWADAEGSGWTRRLALVGTGLNAVELAVSVMPPLDGRKVRPEIWAPREMAGPMPPAWFDVVSEDRARFFVGVRGVAVASGAPTATTMTIGADGGLRAHVRLEPEQSLELELITFFPTVAPEGTGPTSDEGER